MTPGEGYPKTVVDTESGLRDDSVQARTDLWNDTELLPARLTYDHPAPDGYPETMKVPSTENGSASTTHSPSGYARDTSERARSSSSAISSGKSPVFLRERWVMDMLIHRKTQAATPRPTRATRNVPALAPLASRGHSAPVLQQSRPVVTAVLDERDTP